MGAKDSVQFGGHIDLTSNAADIVKELKLVQNALKAISDIANGMGLEKYWRDQDSAISSLRKSYNEFLSVQNRDTASELIKTTNALKAMGVDIARNVSGVEKLDEALSKARSTAPDIASIYNIDSFRNLFNALDTIRDSGQDANVVISKLANNSDVSQLNQQIRTLEIQLANSKNEAASLEGELKSLKDNTGVGELEEQVERLQRRLERVREVAEEEFDNFLRGHEIQPDEWEFSSYYENIRDGSETAIDAISRFKVEYQHLFDKSDNGNAALALFDSFQLKISSLTSKIEELTSMIQDMVENGVKTASDGSANSLQGIADAMRQINDASSNGASSAQQNITQLVERLNDLAGVDITALTNVRGILLSIVNMNDLKITPTPAKNIGLLLDAVKSFGDTGANVALPDFKKIFGGLEINTTSLKDLATYLPKFAGLDLSGLSGLSAVDFSGFNNVNVDKSISSIAKLATAVNGVDVSNVNNFLTGLDFSKLQSASTGVDKGLGTVINALVKLKSLNDGDLSSVLSLPFENLSKIAINENAAQSISELADSTKKFAESKEAIREIVDFLRSYQASSASQTPNSPIVPLDVVDFGNGAEKIRKAYNGLSQDDDNLRSKMEQSTVVGKKYIATLQEIVSYKKDEKTNETVPSGAQTIVTYDFKKYRDEQAKNQKQIEDEANAYTRLKITIGAYMAQLNSSISTSREVGVVNDNNVKSLSDIVAKLGLVKRATESQEPGKFREIAKEFLEIKASADEYKRAVDNASKAQAKVVKDDKSRQAEIDSYNKLQYTLDGYIAKLKDSVSASEKSGVANSENVENLKTTIELFEELSASLKSQDVGKFKEFNSVYLVLRNFAGEYQRLTDEETEAQRQSERNAEAARKESDEYVRLERDINTYVASLKKRIEAAMEAGVADDESVAKLQRIIESLEELSRSASTPGNAGIEAIDSELIRLKRDGDEAARSVESVVNASIKSSADAIREKEEALKAVSKYEQIRKQIANDINRSSKAENGRSAEDYAKLKGFATEVENLYEQYKHHDITAAEFADRLREIGNSAAGSANNIRLAGEMTKSFSTRIKDSFKSLTAYFGAHRAIMLVIRYMRDLVKTSIDLDKEMGNLRIVTNESTESLENYSRAIAGTAKEISSSMTDLITATTTFARLGYSLEDSSVLAKYTAMLQQVGDIDASSAQDAVTAITKAFADEVDINNIESVMDRLVVVGRIIAHVCSNAYLVIGYNGQSRFGVIA